MKQFTSYAPATSVSSDADVGGNAEEGGERLRKEEKKRKKKKKEKMKKKKRDKFVPNDECDSIEDRERYALVATSSSGDLKLSAGSLLEEGGGRELTAYRDEGISDLTSSRSKLDEVVNYDVFKKSERESDEKEEIADEMWFNWPLLLKPSGASSSDETFSAPQFLTQESQEKDFKDGVSYNAAIAACDFVFRALKKTRVGGFRNYFDVWLARNCHVLKPNLDGDVKDLGVKNSKKEIATEESDGAPLSSSLKESEYVKGYVYSEVHGMLIPSTVKESKTVLRLKSSMTSSTKPPSQSSSSSSRESEKVEARNLVSSMHTSMPLPLSSVTDGATDSHCAMVVTYDDVVNCISVMTCLKENDVETFFGNIEAHWKKQTKVENRDDGVDVNVGVDVGVGYEKVEGDCAGDHGMKRKRKRKRASDFITSDSDSDSDNDEIRSKAVEGSNPSDKTTYDFPATFRRLKSSIKSYFTCRPSSSSLVHLWLKTRSFQVGDIDKNIKFVFESDAASFERCKKHVEGGNEMSSSSSSGGGSSSLTENQSLTSSQVLKDYIYDARCLLHITSRSHLGESPSTEMENIVKSMKDIDLLRDWCISLALNGDCVKGLKKISNADNEGWLTYLGYFAIKNYFENSRQFKQSDASVNKSDQAMSNRKKNMKSRTLEKLLSSIPQKYATLKKYLVNRDISTLRSIKDGRHEGVENDVLAAISALVIDDVNKKDVRKLVCIFLLFL